MTPIPVIFLLLLSVHLCGAIILNRKGLRKSTEAARLDKIVFFPVLPFIVLLMARVRSRKPVTILMATLQTVLFIFACVLGSRMGYLSRELISPLAIGMGLIAAHAIFGLSLLVTHRGARDVLDHLTDLKPLWHYLVEHPRVMMQFICVAVAEELIYRVGAQPLLIGLTGSVAVGIVLSATAFSLAHEHFFKNSLGQSGEFLVFSLLLGSLFYWTQSLILIIVIHAVRNIEIAFIEHLNRVEESGGEILADCEDEYLSGESALVLVISTGKELPVSCFQYRPDLPAAIRVQPAVNQA